jgi:transposase-like protein
VIAVARCWWFTCWYGLSYRDIEEIWLAETVAVAR